MQTIRSVQLGGTLAALCLAPLFFGSVDHVWMSIWLIVLSTSTICGGAVQLTDRQRLILLVFVLVCCVYAFAAIVQVVPGFFDQLDDPIWGLAKDALQGGVLPRISSRAEIPPVSIGHFLLVLTSFASGFFVGSSRSKAEVLIAAARYSILVYAVYGLVALAFTPNMLLWAPKLAYHGSVTASFVNHNTAATFIGGGAILWFCLAFHTGQSLRFSSLRVLLLTPSYERIAFRLILQLAAGLVCFFALLLTRSRGGLICSSLGILVAIGLMLARTLRPKFWHLAASASLALIVMIVWLSQMGRIGSQGLFDDGRWFVYQYCIEAIRQHPLLGAGAGTFADLFPSLRGADFDSGGIWEQAHSTVLEIFVEMGIPVGATILIGACASLFILGRGTLRSANGDRNFLAAITGIAVLGFSHSAIDFSLQIPGYLIVFWILLGCGLARTSAEKMGVANGRSRRSVAAGYQNGVRNSVNEGGRI